MEREAVGLGRQLLFPSALLPQHVRELMFSNRDRTQIRPEMIETLAKKYCDLYPTFRSFVSNNTATLRKKLHSNKKIISRIYFARILPLVFSR